MRYHIFQQEWSRSRYLKREISRKYEIDEKSESDWQNAGKNMRTEIIAPKFGDELEIVKWT